MGNTSYSQINSVSRVRFEITLRSNTPCTKKQCQFVAGGVCERKATENLSTIQPSNLILRIPLSPARKEKKRKKKKRKSSNWISIELRNLVIFQRYLEFRVPVDGKLTHLTVPGGSRFSRNSTRPRATGNLITARLFDGKSDTFPMNLAVFPPPSVSSSSLLPPTVDADDVRHLRTTLDPWGVRGVGGEHSASWPPPRERGFSSRGNSTGSLFTIQNTQSYATG